MVVRKKWEKEVLYALHVSEWKERFLGNILGVLFEDFWLTLSLSLVYIHCICWYFSSITFCRKLETFLMTVAAVGVGG